MNIRLYQALFSLPLALTVLGSGCGLSNRPPAAEKPSVEVAAPEPPPPSKAEIFREVEKISKKDPDVSALDEKLENYKILRRFWMVEKARTERPNRIFAVKPQAKASKERIAEAQRRNLYETNLASERAIALDEYIRRLDAEIFEMENRRSELIVQKIENKLEKK